MLIQAAPSRMQGWTGKTQPGLTHLVKTGLNYTEKPPCGGKWVFINFSPLFWELKPNLSKNYQNLYLKDCQNLFPIGNI